MSEKKKSIYGTVGWFDLTVSNAADVKDFYNKVTEWDPQPVSMGDYDDYNMTIDGDPIAGVCHQKGGNSDVPPNG